MKKKKKSQNNKTIEGCPMVWLHCSNGLIYDTHSTQILQKQEGGCNIYAIMKTMCHPSYYHNDFVATHALGHMMYGCV